MSTPATTAQAPVGTDHRAVPAHARQLAARLSALFDRDVEIVKRLNDAHQLLANANQHLDGLAASDTLTLPDIRWQIHRAFCAYQDAAERRRQLAVDVGEIAQQLNRKSRCRKATAARTTVVGPPGRWSDGWRHFGSGGLG